MCLLFGLHAHLLHLACGFRDACRQPHSFVGATQNHENIFALPDLNRREARDITDVSRSGKSQIHA